MPRRRRVVRDRAGVLLLDSAHDDELDLVIGPRFFVEPGSAEDERLREAWTEHRDELMTDLPPGQRPWGWYRFERGLSAVPNFTVVDRKGFVVEDAGGEAEWLQSHGFLTVFEKRALAEATR